MSVAPEIRFPGFEDEWEAIKLSDVLRPKGQRNRDGKYSRQHVLSVSGDLGVVNQIVHLGRSYAGADVGEYHVVDRGDVVYTKSPLKENPFGIIKVNHGDPGIVSTLYAVYEVKDRHSPAFVGRYFESDDRTNSYLMPLVNKGAKNDMKISNERVLIDTVRFPGLAEQRKIADFLDTVDARIVAADEQRAGIERFKAGLLQALFTQEVQFLDESGAEFPDWEELPFAQIAERRRVGFAPTGSGDSPTLIELENIESGTGRLLCYSALDGQNSIKSRFLAGEVLFGKLRPYLRKYARPDFDGVCSSEIWVLNGLKVRNDFLFFLVQTEAFMEVATVSSGSKMPRAEWPVISAAKFSIPHPDEQAKIAAALRAPDRRLDAARAEATALASWKAGLLQKMFA